VARRNRHQRRILDPRYTEARGSVQLEAGHFQSVDEVFGEALRLLREIPFHFKILAADLPPLLDDTVKGNISLGRITRENYFFVTWKGDHSPRHVHVFKDGKLIVKWDLENDLAMKGRATRRILRIIGELREEGLL
jgi:hypothetical protein